MFCARGIDVVLCQRALVYPVPRAITAPEALGCVFDHRIRESGQALRSPQRRRLPWLWVVAPFDKDVLGAAGSEQKQHLGGVQANVAKPVAHSPREEHDVPRAGHRREWPVGHPRKAENRNPRLVPACAAEPVMLPPFALLVDIAHAAGARGERLLCPA
jgi:hypothetical protein